MKGMTDKKARNLQRLMSCLDAIEVELNKVAELVGHVSFEEFTSRGEGDSFSGAVRECGLGWLIGMTPREGETKEDFKTRCVESVRSNPLESSLLGTIQEASLDDIWGYRC